MYHFHLTGRQSPVSFVHKAVHMFSPSSGCGEKGVSPPLPRAAVRSLN